MCNFFSKRKIISDFGSSNKDSGSIKVQIAILTNKINYLHNHFSKHKKDYHSRRGLINMIVKRRKLLNYLKNKNINKYNILVKQLKLRG